MFFIHWSILIKILIYFYDILISTEAIDENICINFDKIFDGMFESHLHLRLDKC